MNGTIFGREPAVILGLINAAITLALTFGLSLSVEQVGAILAFVNIGIAFITRSRVYSPAAIEQMDNETETYR